MNKDTKKMDNCIECFICHGEGYIEASSPSCFKSASECCGGCYAVYECDYCDMDCKIYPLDEQMNEEILMVRAYRNMLIDLKALHHELKMLSNECSENAEATMQLLMNEQYTNDVNALVTQIDRVEKHHDILLGNIKEEIERHNGN
tara:strand:+ start:2016 stop:2453 length:438 start_codon:yes stop_codon:yes gene_type:complete